MSRLLLVEDDESLGATLQERLIKEGHQVDWAQNKAAAENFYINAQYDLIILDVGLPDGTGFEFAETVRTNSNIPFIFVTAMANAEYRLQGYELGADEYIPKPFHLKEFLMRVSHVLDNHTVQNTVVINGYNIDFQQMTITAADNTVEHLSSRESQVLALLIQQAPNVVSRDDMLNHVWKNPSTSNRSIDNCIVRLRQALGDERADIIRTVRGVGYQCIEWRK